MSFFQDIKPAPFLNARVRDLGLEPPLTALCASYDAGRWRDREFASYLFDFLPEFCLSYSELKGFNAGTGRRLLRKAALLVYGSDKYRLRGEFGELLLHAVVREEFGSEPAVSKIFFKGTVDEAVKGFDCVHIVSSDHGELELWLGEVKFYEDISSAMAAVTEELQAHVDRDWLRNEFLLVGNRIDDEWPHAEALRRLIDEREPLDRVFKRIRVPVLLTYDSKAVRDHNSEDGGYPDAFEAEVRELQARFASRDLPIAVLIHLILVPLFSKADFVKRLDEKLKAWQTI
jgi:Cap4 SAVED domain